MSVKHRALCLESVISYILLAILLLIGAGVFFKQFDYVADQFNADTKAKDILQTDSSRNKDILISLLPTGFKEMSEVEVYTPENLYEKIDGKADFYIEAGFTKLLSQRFVNNHDPQQWAEVFIYDMGDIKNAFSVFSIQRRADSDILSLFHPDFGYKTLNGLYFVHGRYYIEIVGSSESKELFAAIIEISQKIPATFNIDDKQITEPALFPKENLVPGTIKLYKTNTFGFEGLTDTFAAKYKLGSDEITAFLSRRVSPQDAQKVSSDYYKFLLDNGGKDIPSNNPQTKMVDFYGDVEIIQIVDSFIIGTHEAENQQAAEKLILLLAENLKK